MQGFKRRKEPHNLSPFNVVLPLNSYVYKYPLELRNSRPFDLERDRELMDVLATTIKSKL